MRTICRFIAKKLASVSTTNQLCSWFRQPGGKGALHFAGLPIGRGAIVATTLTILLGCSMHPLPEDVSRKNTYDIVKKIRCEVAEGLYAYAATDPVVANTFIGYDFDFDITETNNLGTNGSRGTLTLEQKLLSPSGTFKLDVRPFAESSRQTQRTFRIIERLKDLKKLNGQQCSPTQANWAYPITGTIGINEVVDTYIGLEKLTDFAKESGGTTTLPTPPPAPPATPPATPKDATIVFSDVLTYTTHFGLGITPDLTLNSAVGTLKLTKASIGADANRKDKHKVTVALARDLTVQVDERGRRIARTARVNTGDMEYVRSINSSINARASRNADAVARKLLTGPSQVLVELERRRNLIEDETTAGRLLEILRPLP